MKVPLNLPGFSTLRQDVPPQSTHRTHPAFHGINIINKVGSRHSERRCNPTYSLLVKDKFKSTQGKAAPFDTAAHSEKLSKGGREHHCYQRVQSHSVPCLIKPRYYRIKTETSILITPSDKDRARLPSYAKVASQSWRQVFNLVPAFHTNLIFEF